MKDNYKISVIIPLYNEELNIDAIYKRLNDVMILLNQDYEFYFINDGSSDNTLALVKELSQKNPKVHYKSFSRNFGHQNAVSAGIDSVSSDCTIIIDADLQDPPELIPEMIAKWQEGYKVVYAQRKERKGESIFKKLTAKIFYRILRKLSEVEIPLDTGDFRLIDKKVVEVMRLMPEKNKYLRGMIAWSGFKQIGIQYVRDKRYAGKSNYPLKKMMQFALNGIVSFSSYPLVLAAYFGFFITILSLIFSAVVLYHKLFTDNTVPGWTSLILVILFLGGINLICIGFLGLYISRISNDVKNRPVYIIEEEK